MSIIRIEKTKDYTVMSNYHLRDKNLSLKAKGLMSLMLSLPDDWDYSVAGLSQICLEGKDSITNALNELEQNGYLVREQNRTDNGQFGGANYVLYENPSTEQPMTENPMTANPLQLNTNIQSTKELNTNNIKENKKEKHKYGNYGWIKLTDNEYQKLINDFGETYAKQVIDRIDEYVQSNGNKNKYKDFNLVIRKAIRDKWSCLKDIKTETTNMMKGVTIL